MIWDADMSYLPGERVPDHISLELQDDSEARVTNFPRGRSVQDDDGHYCIAGSASERYTGDATWQARTRGSFFVEFEDSKILVSASARFGEMDWTLVRFVACETEQEWDLGYVCGDSGYGADDREPPVFRDECLSSD